MRYAVVNAGTVVGVVVWDGVSPWASPWGGDAVAVPDGTPCGAGYIYTGGQFVSPDSPPVVWDWDMVRAHRDALLAASDWTQVADAPVDAAAWAAYRQALRDVPQDFATPDAVVWPTPPA